MWINYNLKEQHSITVDRRGWGREGGEESRGIGQRVSEEQKATTKAYPGGGQVVEGSLHGTLPSSTRKGRQRNKKKTWFVRMLCIDTRKNKGRGD